MSGYCALCDVRATSRHYRTATHARAVRRRAEVWSRDISRPHGRPGWAAVLAATAITTYPD